MLCKSGGCFYKIHTNPANNNGNHCCHRCMNTPNNHGPLCEHMKQEGLTIITPCCRQANLQRIYNSINFDKIDKWIIVYDTSKDRKYEKIFTWHPKIREEECNGGISGNPQRNHGISLVQDGFIYFLDDDNIIHPDFWSIVENLDPQYFYTFNQQRTKNGYIFYGNNITAGCIDTAMYLVHKQHIRDIRWCYWRYDADGYFITDILNNNRDMHKFIDKVCCYYNFLTWKDIVPKDD